MRESWNIKDYNSITIARLLSELEGCSQILNALEEDEDYDIIQLLKSKYYKRYFELHKIEKKNANN